MNKKSLCEFESEVYVVLVDDCVVCGGKLCEER